MGSKRLTIDDLLGCGSSDEIRIEQDKKGKPRVKKPKQPKLTYKQKYPVFFSLIRKNPMINDPVEEFRFHPKRRWQVDICWPGIKLALEVEGGVWTKGRHLRPTGFMNDMEKYNNLSILGYALLRVTPQQMENHEAYAIVEEWLINNRKINHENRTL